MLRIFYFIFLLVECFQRNFADVANDEDSLKMPAYKVARAGHYPMVYDRVTGIPWPCNPFGEEPKDPDAEKDPSFIKLTKCPEEEKKTRKVKKSKRFVRNAGLGSYSNTWKKFLKTFT